MTELFPVSSLGHSVLVPAWIGGSWQTLVTQSSEANSDSSFYLAFIVALHVATALALLWFFRVDWIRIVRGFFRSFARSMRGREFSVLDADERLAWLVVIATIPVGLTGVLFEHLTTSGAQRARLLPGCSRVRYRRGRHGSGFSVTIHPWR